MERIIKAEAAASGAEKDPEITVIDHFPVLENDADTVARATAAIGEVLGSDKVVETPAATGSEDVGILAAAVKAAGSTRTSRPTTRPRSPR